MATTKIWKVDYRLDHVINYATDETKTKNDKNEKECNEIVNDILEYAMNNDKTEKQYFVTGVNCNADNAVKEMIEVKKKFNKYKSSPQNKSIAFHAVQSFVEGEVTPSIAHEIGVKLAEEMWGDRFQVVVTTHLNTDNIHNHFVVNSVSFVDGKKYYSNRKNTGIFRKLSDDLCSEYGLSVLDSKDCKKGMINFEYYYNDYVKKDDYYNFIKEDIDYAIKSSWAWNEFQQKLRNMEYSFYIRVGKISIKKNPYKRYIRIERTFGDEYSIDNIKARILEREPVIEKKNFVKLYDAKVKYKSAVKSYKKPKGLKALYKYYCYLLKVYPKKNMNYKLSFEMRKEIKKMEEYSKENRFVCKYDITDYSSLDNAKIEINNKLKDLIRQRNNLYYQRQHESKIENKDKISLDIEVISKEITKARDEVKMCNSIKEKIKVMREQIKELEELEERENQQEVHIKNKLKVK